MNRNYDLISCGSIFDLVKAEVQKEPVVQLVPNFDSIEDTPIFDQVALRHLDWLLSSMSETSTNSYKGKHRADANDNHHDASSYDSHLPLDWFEAEPQVQDFDSYAGRHALRQTIIYED